MFVLLYALSVIAKNYAILLNSSRGFCNYRHMANVYVFCNILKNNGFQDDEMIILSYENQIEDLRNVSGSLVHLDDDWTIPYFPFSPTGSTFEALLNAIEGNNRKLMHADESSNILIYLCGHGNETFLKFGNMYFMTKNDLMSRVLRLVSRVNKVLLILDTCQAEALVDRHELPDNLFILTTSREGEPSISSFSSSLLSVNVVDNFPYFFLKRVDEGLDEDTRLIDLFSSLDINLLGSNLEFDARKEFTFGDFFIQRHSDVLLPFR